MPTYIVRWPNLSASLVRASNEDELLSILDEVANPSGCTWTIYRGPLFLDFELNVKVRIEGADTRTSERPINPEDIHIEGAADIADFKTEEMRVSSIGETGVEMEQAIAEFAFPATANALWGDHDGRDPDELEDALRDDAMRLVENTWRTSHLHRSKDPDAALALQMDAPVEWIKNRRRQLNSMDADDNGDYETTIEEDIHDMLETARADWLDTQDPDKIAKILQLINSLLEDYKNA